MQNKTLRDWAIYRLNDFHTFHHQIDYAGYSILYTAIDEVKIHLNEHEIFIPAETFYFIPPKSKFHISENHENAIVLWFQIEVFVHRLEFLYQIEKGMFFKDPKGLAVSNTFMPYQEIVNNYYLPIEGKDINKLLKKHMLTNFIEFILIRSLIDRDPTLEHSTKNSYEKEIADRFVAILDEEDTYNFTVMYYADKLHITKRTLDSAIQTIFGCSTKKYITGQALEKAKVLLRGTSLPVKNISQDIGFSEESNFHNFFKKHSGVTPKEFRTNSNSTTPEIEFNYSDTE
ncbi:MAG: helix-turn-helix transcriptional regulator [Kaistella sp.]|nr:helix-turn-helix transcriptional regulator [Kaistella sp.]